MIILKDAYLFTFNPKIEFGKYSIFIREGRISEIIKSRELKEGEDEIPRIKKWIEQSNGTAEIVDCSDKVIIPALVNSCVKSEGSLVKYLLRKRHYENEETDLCTDLIFNYLYQDIEKDELNDDLRNIYNYSFTRQLKSGIGFMNEFSPRKDTNHFSPIKKAVSLTGQTINCCYAIKQEQSIIIDNKSLRPSYYLTDENQFTLFDLTALANLKNSCISRLFLEVATNKSITETFRQSFGKPIITLLNEYGLIDKNTTLINPLYLEYEEMKILADKGANVIICPRDLVNFSSRYFPLDDFIAHNIKLSIGTGWLGEDLFKEIRLLRHRYRELNIPSDVFFKSVTSTPFNLYFNDTDEENYLVDINKPANLTFINLSDIRFQLFPENISSENVCDFFIDNLEANVVSDVMLNGKFKVKDNKPSDVSEEEILSSSYAARKHLYKIGRYEEFRKRAEQRRDTELLDMSGRDDSEIKLFTEGEETQQEVDLSGKEEFRIKGKIPVFRSKTSPMQKSLFEEHDLIHVNENEFEESPSLNLLFNEVNDTQDIEEEIMQSKITEAHILLRHKPEDKPAEKPKPHTVESKVELPKNVKLKFGD